MYNADLGHTLRTEPLPEEVSVGDCNTPTPHPRPVAKRLVEGYPSTEELMEGYLVPVLYGV